MIKQFKPDHSEHQEQVSQNTSQRAGMAQTSRQLSRLHNTFQRKAKAMAARRSEEAEPAPERMPAVVG